MTALIDRRLVRGVLFAAIGGFATALLALLVTQEAGRLASIQPANALLVGVLLLLPRRQWTPVALAGALANFLANLVIGDGPLQAASLMSFNIIEALLGAWILRKLHGHDVGVISRRWLFDLVVWAGLLACAVSATLASIFLSANGASFGAAWITYFPAHFLGVVTIVPVIVALARSRRELREQRLGRDLAALTALTVTVSLAIFLQEQLPLHFLIWPVLTYAAFRAGVPGATAAGFVFTVIAIGMTLRGEGPIMLIAGGELSRVLFLQFYILTATFSTIPIGLALADRRAATEALIKARNAAEAAARAKASFLANMSHEIRTPLNGVLGFAELLGMGRLDAEQRHQVAMIASSAEALLALLNDILDISKVDADRLEIARDPVNLAERIHECAALVGPMAEAKGLRVAVEIAADLPTHIIGDALRLRQILLNLLGNAIKFTEIGGITIRARSARSDGERMVEIAVADTGIGIARDRHEMVFEEFSQAEDDTTRRFGGTGLGLAISRRLALLMGGSLRLESEPDVGTILYLSIPLAEAEASPGSRAEAGAAPALQRPARARVLLAEDLDINRELVGAMLARLGYPVEFAADGREAVDMVKAARSGASYDLVLMDVQMPQMSGLEATRAIRAAGIDAAALPIVALTANVFPEDIQACLDAGMQASLAKPVRTADLDEAVRRWAIRGGGAEKSAGEQGGGAAGALRERYAQRKADSIARIGELMRAGALDERGLEEIAELAHKLAGSAGMFGDPAFGALAGEVEQAIESAPPAERQARLEAAIERLRAAA